MKSKNSKKNRINKVISLLIDEYPDSKCSLTYRSCFQLLVATILSAQCTDERVNKVTSLMFKKYPDIEDYYKISIQEIKKLIFSTGFYNNKAKSIKGLSIILYEEYEKIVPKNINDLTRLPGVGRKTANVVLGTYYKIPAIVVDTHVTRLVNLLGICKTKNAVIIERKLMNLIQKKHWIHFTHLFIDHGRKICVANRPKCNQCILIDLCPSSNK